jgi:hypothetical protein
MSATDVSIHHKDTSLTPSDGECRLVRAQLGLQRSSAAKLFPPTEPRATVPGVRPDWTDRPSRLSDSSVVLRGPRTRHRATHRSRLQLLCAYSLDQNVGIPIDPQAGRRRNDEALATAPGRNPQGGGGGCMSKGSEVGFDANEAILRCVGGACKGGAPAALQDPQGCLQSHLEAVLDMKPRHPTHHRPAASSGRWPGSPATACPPGPPPRPSPGCPRHRRPGCARPTSSA